MDQHAFEIFRFVADVALVPMAVMLWNIQGRLSKMEGILSGVIRNGE